MTDFALNWTVAGITLIVSAVVSLTLVKRGGLKVDTPNSRSSHTSPTPRGGGAAFLFASIVGASLFFLFSDFSNSAKLFGIFTLAIACGFIGLLEDVIGISSLHRLLAEVGLATAVALSGLRWQGVNLGLISVDFPTSMSLFLTIFWIVWITNLYNFMDGINGISASTGVVLSAFFSLIAFSGGNIACGSIMLVVAASLLGFLPFNFPRAKIFMGDVGSLFLGFLFAVTPLYLHQKNSPFTSELAALAIAPFLVDSTTTLLVRLFRREKISEAHRSHIYQQLATKFQRHDIVTVIYTAAAIASCALSFYIYSTRQAQQVPILVLSALTILFIGAHTVGSRKVQNRPK